MTQINTSPVGGAALFQTAMAEAIGTLAAFGLMRLTAGSFAGGQLMGGQNFGDARAFPGGVQTFGLSENFKSGRCGCVMPPRFMPVADPITATAPKDGKASVDLGDGYTMTLNERSSEIIITDPSGDKTRIWGDPHVDVNGKRVGDFYDTTTFELNNGTKVTINTEPWIKGGNGTYVASQVVISKGDQGMVIDGISQNHKGDLKITSGLDGRALDFAHDDGFNLTEAGDGKTYGWNSEFTGERVTKAEMKEMTLHANRDLRESMEMGRDLGNAFGAWLLFGDIGALFSLASSESFERETRDEVVRVVADTLVDSLMGRGPDR